MKKKILIVGQGIAGTVLTFTLIGKEDLEITILDNNPQTSSSKVAAGLYNPIVFKRLMHSWNANEVIPKLKEFYSKIEILLNTSFHFTMPLLKILSNEEEKQFWLKKSKQVEMWDYISQDILKSYKPDFINQHSGFAEVFNAGFVDLKVFLVQAREYFVGLNIYIQSYFDYSELKIENNATVYKKQNYDYIIFAEGYNSLNNPYFKWLPFVPAKGEVLTLKIPNYDSDKIVNKNLFVLPLGNDLYKVGATYNWLNLNEEVTEVAKIELLEKLKDVLKCDFELINQEAGIRPSILDRRPIIGAHPSEKSLLIFNGLGTKGVMLAPFVAESLSEFILKGVEIESEINVSRFYKFYPNGR
ncbi:MAG: FAD-binding oxidoreductase [Candidatus Kapabacteria bacterium]|nr:FAD-binding oxidoreductase [Candidatus Kapabacteria bacterium]